MTGNHRQPPEAKLEAIEDRRKRIARELHDSVGVRLRAAKFDLERFTQDTQPALSEEQRSRLNTISRKLADTLAEIRQVALRLRPTMLEDLGMVATLSWFVREFSATYPQIKVYSDINIADSDVPQALRTLVFRVVQEAFNNIAKHANASVASLILSRSDQTLFLTIKDNGSGFRPAEHGKHSDGMGLYIMRERLLGSGGTLNLRSTVGTGTVVNVEWSL